MEKSSKKNWSIMKSKSQPGRCYMFNKSTGESKWCKKKQTTFSNNLSDVSVGCNLMSCESLLHIPQNPVLKLSDRLKISQFNPNSKKRKSHYDGNETNSKRKKNMNNSTCVEETNFSLKNPPKQCRTCLLPRDGTIIPEFLKKVETSTLKNDTKYENPTNKFLDTPSTSQNSLRKTISSDSCERPISFFSRVIVEKVKEIYQNSIRKLVKCTTSQNEEKNLISTVLKEEKDDNQNMLYNLNKIFNKELDKDDIIKTVQQTNCLSDNSANINANFSLAIRRSITGYKKGSANTRLDNLRHSLTKFAKDIDPMENINYDFIVDRKVVKSTPDDCMIATENSNNSNKGPQSMDWQLISVNCETEQIFKDYNALMCSNLDKNEKEKLSTMSKKIDEHILNSMNYQEANRKLRSNFFYFILDTNVILRYISFIDNLSKLKLCDTQGSVLYIPYRVLQELDKLKYNKKKGSISLLANQAIKFINNKFENRCLDLQAQSALDELDTLIELESPDDSIINCCLQVKKIVPNILLLTEDVNLRNKAISSGILVTTINDLKN